MKVKSYKAGSVGEVELDVAPFGEKVLYRTLKDAVVMHMANQRQGTASTKGRSEVKGTNKKPYKQKHTGRARAGDVKSPIWRGGGTVFGPKPRDYSYHMPTKARRVALRSAIAGKIADWATVDEVLDYTRLFSIPMYAALACIAVLALLYPGGSTNAGSSGKVSA